MRILRLADMKDGLCCVYSAYGNDSLQIDWGSQQGGDIAVKGWQKMMQRRNAVDAFPTDLILSHFHTDHYNGFISATRQRERHMRARWARLRGVFLAGLPMIPDREKFLRCLLAADMRVLGGLTGHVAVDFFEMISRLTEGGFSYRFLFQGDEFEAVGLHFKCVWPPRQLDGKYIGGRIDQALRKYEDARRGDETLRELERWVDRTEFYRGLSNSPEIPDGQQFADRWSDSGHLSGLLLENVGREVPKVVEAANQALRDIANELSLVFHEGETFLFCGDLENRNISAVVDQLEEEDCRDFRFFVAPHHGTHWHRSMARLRANECFVSIGPKLLSKYRFELGSISGVVHSTYFGGDMTSVATS